MGVQDDFDLWESELRGLLPPSPDPLDTGAPVPPPLPARPKPENAPDAPVDDSTDRRPGGRALLAVSALLGGGCALLFYLGGEALGAVVLVLCALILLLWRIGW
ncbi:hypothetical protein [Thermomonospora cellulosilytica]|uniref:Uncharacterized protein n=1 Tax=Thermomonospora cellulosilytica TaxID=1411118 RepID=A0A7W3MUJ7_9ACTN|nr:hypothetical protein [Thermomonospora cellulosilytica]MBA9002183.1 hypothetical protein [Thermomonospora cellulosilytica]